MQEHPLRCSECGKIILKFVWAKEGEHDPLCGECAAKGLPKELKEKVLEADNCGL